MKRVIISLLMLISLVCCFSCGKRNIHSSEGTSSMYAYESIITLRQLDSICIADTLLTMDNWIKTTFYDYEINEKYVKYMFIKDLDNDREITYIITEQDTVFRLIKRIGKTE